GVALDDGDAFLDPGTGNRVLEPEVEVQQFLLKAPHQGGARADCEQQEENQQSDDKAEVPGLQELGRGLLSCHASTSCRRPSAAVAAASRPFSCAKPPLFFAAKPPLFFAAKPPYLIFPITFNSTSRFLARRVHMLCA